MAEKPDEKKMERKPYRKPEIEEVQLVAEEATLTNCKFDLASPGGHGPAAGCVNSAGTCVEFGS